MWKPNSEYKTKQQWLEFEDKALIMCWGITDIHEIAEAFMCFPIDLLNRARQLGIMPAPARLMTAQHIETLIQLLESGASIKSVTDLFNLPDVNYIYASVPLESIPEANRQIQDYWAKRNDNQYNLFRDSEE